MFKEERWLRNSFLYFFSNKLLWDTGINMYLYLYNLYISICVNTYIGINRSFSFKNHSDCDKENSHYLNRFIVTSALAVQPCYFWYVAGKGHSERLNMGSHFKSHSKIVWNVEAVKNFKAKQRNYTDT